MGIYTKTGDKGTTSLIGGKRISKSHVRLEAYGTIDELNSWIGLIRDQNLDSHTSDLLREIQSRLFDVGSILASDPDNPKSTVPQLAAESVTLLENEIDAISDILPQLRSFIIPGGHTVSSYCHIARCVCRRAERIIVSLEEKGPLDEAVKRYVNRLSDYLFVLARKVLVDNKLPEEQWKAPR